MLWNLNTRMTRSGKVFSAWAGALNFAPLLSRAVATETEDDHESDDDLSDVDEEWPPNPLNDIDEEWPPPDPMNDVDDLPPAPPSRKRRASPTFEDVAPTAAALLPTNRRAIKRARVIEAEGYTPRPSTIAAHVTPAVPVTMPAFNAASLPAALELIQLGFQLIPWNGFDARPLLDSEGRIFLVLAGQPRDEKYHTAVSRAFAFLKKEGDDAAFPRRHALPPTRLNKSYPGLTDRLLHNPDIARMANFASFCFKLWAPRLHDYYVDYKRATPDPLPRAQAPLPQISLLLRRVQLWLERLDSLGNFDPQRGGHLVLWDLKLVVEFPAGALILLPSATIAHSNIPVDTGDERMSFTQFTAGELFRHMDYGFRTQADFAAEDPTEYAKAMDARASRWAEGLALYSTIEELQGFSLDEMPHRRAPLDADTRQQRRRASRERYEAKNLEKRREAAKLRMRSTRATIADSDYHTRRRYRERAAAHSESYRDRLDATEREQRRIADAESRRVRKQEAESLRKKHEAGIPRTPVKNPASKTPHKAAKNWYWTPRSKNRSPAPCSVQCSAAAAPPQMMRTAPQMMRSSRAGHSSPSRSFSSRRVRPILLGYGARHAGSTTARDALACARCPSDGLITPVAISFRTARVAAGLTAPGVHVRAPNLLLSWSTGDI
ncbi:hypothetical protein B0H14DRAFT_3861110 [Mycena olivaceomarginata]|nr:hypothetical protein B0H14DRAFT_3861110 [Mycena olivaceomarginata]